MPSILFLLMHTIHLSNLRTLKTKKLCLLGPAGDSEAVFCSGQNSAPLCLSEARWGRGGKGRNTETRWRQARSRHTIQMFEKRLKKRSGPVVPLFRGGGGCGWYRLFLVQGSCLGSSADGKFRRMPIIRSLVRLSLVRRCVFVIIKYMALKKAQPVD